MKYIVEVVDEEVLKWSNPTEALKDVIEGVFGEDTVESIEELKVDSEAELEELIIKILNGGIDNECINLLIKKGYFKESEKMLRINGLLRQIKKESVK